MREHRIRKTKTVCTYCGVGCSFDVWTKDRHILKVEPEHGPANGISTCVKGKFGWDFVNSPDRLTKPLIREGDKFREASWDEALALVARQIHRRSKQRSGPDSLGVHLLFQVHERRELSDAEVGAGGDRHEQHGQLLALLPVAGDRGFVPHRGLRRRFGLDLGYREGRPGADHRQQHGGEPSGAGHAGQERAQAATARS